MLPTSLPRFRRRPVAALLFALLLLPAAQAADETQTPAPSPVPESSEAPAQAAPEPALDPRQERLIAPDVIPQGEFALHLANALGVRLPDGPDPLKGIRALNTLGIAPRAGWEPEAAVTPDTIAELSDAVAIAASAGRLRFDPPEAVGALEHIVVQLGLPLPADPPRLARDEPPVKRYEDGCPDPETYRYYYGETGVPPYTYCPPPPAYYPMYTWVPSPFYWHDYYFSGFYALRYPYVIVRPRPVPPPRFSEGVLGGDRRVTPTPPPPATGTGPGWRDLPATRVPRAIPLPDRAPRYSEGILGGGDRSVPRVRPSVPPAGSTGITPSTRPSIRSAPRPAPSPPPAARPAPAPSPAPGGGGRGWRDTIGR